MNEITNMPNLISAYPVVNKNVELKEYSSIPISEISSLGVSFMPIAQAIGGLFSGGGSGLYRADVPKGYHLARFKSGKGYLGSALSNSTNQVGAQASFTPIIDPTMIFVSCALMCITQKLDDCVQIGERVLKRLNAVEKAKIVGNITFMNDIYNDYKYKWNNTRYIESSLNNCKSIRKESEASIELQNQILNDAINDNRVINSDKYVTNKYNTIVNALKNYQLALYMRSFSMFLETIFEESFDPQYLKNISQNIYNYSVQYKEKYTDCYNYLESFNRSSVKSKLLKGSSYAAKNIGKAVEKVPIVNKSQIDENLIGFSKKLNALDESIRNKTMLEFSELRNEYSKNITDSIAYISSMFNTNLDILFDNNNVYYKTVSE